MFKTIVTGLVVLAVCLLIMDRCSRARVAEIMAHSDAELATVTAVIKDLHGAIAQSEQRETESTQRYESERSRSERLEIELKKKTSNQATTPQTGPPLVIDWESIYNDYFAANQGYIASNEALRLERDAQVKEHGAQALAWRAIDAQRVETIEGLTLARNRLAALRSPRWVVVFGGGATYGEDGRLHYGLQLTAGLRVDDLFFGK